MNWIFIFSCVFSLLLKSGYSSEFDFVVASMFRNEGPYLKEWIEYHKMIGVDHFFLYNDRSSDDWEKTLTPYLEDGIIEVFDWPSTNPFSHRENQRNAFKNAIEKSRGRAAWFAFIDIDEFILPMKGTTLKECLNTYFNTASAIYVNWRCFGTGGKTIPLGEPILFELTASSFQFHPKNSIGKSIIRPECADVGALSSVHFCPLKEGYSYQNGDRLEMTFVKENLETPKDLRTDGRTHPYFIRINHYIMRDESYMKGVRLGKDGSERRSYDRIPDSVVLSENESLSSVNDYSLIRFVKQNYPEMAENFWKQPKGEH